MINNKVNISIILISMPLGIYHFHLNTKVKLLSINFILQHITSLKNFNIDITTLLLKDIVFL